jgi:hypothetical protein
VRALANEEVGTYLNEHFICTFQKVGSFLLLGGRKQGGNVASYFCAPDNRVLHAVAGPVRAATLLREARWVVETCKLAVLQARGDAVRYAGTWRLAHAERLEHDHAFMKIDWQRLPLYTATEESLTWLLGQPYAGTLNGQGKVHLLLAACPVAPLDECYRVVYEQVVGERVSGRPVTETP